MKKGELLAYVYDFISQLIENEGIFNNARRIILFGSLARGDFTQKSDIDLFIDVKSIEEEKVDNLVKKELNKFEARAERTWFLRKINLPIKPIVGNIEQDKWKDLREEISNYGKIIYGNFEYLPESIKHKVLISYNMTKLSQKRKMSFLRKLYGYTIKKGRKKYIQVGRINDINGERIDTNSILFDINDIGQVKSLLKEYKIKYALRDVFVR